MNYQHFCEELVSCALAERSIVWRPVRPAGPKKLLDLAIRAYVPFISRGILHVSTTFNRNIGVWTANTWADVISHADFYLNPEVINTVLRDTAVTFFADRDDHTDFIYIALVTNLCGRCVITDHLNMIDNAIAALVYYLNLMGEFVGAIHQLDAYVERNVGPRR